MANFKTLINEEYSRRVIKLGKKFVIEPYFDSMKVAIVKQGGILKVYDEDKDKEVDFDYLEGELYKAIRGDMCIHCFFTDDNKFYVYDISFFNGKLVDELHLGERKRLLGNVRISNPLVLNPFLIANKTDMNQVIDTIYELDLSNNVLIREYSDKFNFEEWKIYVRQD